MVTWGDYAITAVRYNHDETKIKQVKRRVVHEDKLSSPTVKDRQTIVSSIDSGDEYTTAQKRSNGNWGLGEEVHVVKLSSGKYIRTDQNNTPEDNLENLPTF